jgi:2-C-methyl-D-erythritol 4-phosphate cytidylyltransferase/2-C-methyl-D-erythritol 2,4-cyclodiphosphate synthase
VVIHPDDAESHDAALKGLGDARLLPPVMGGATRALSVKAGLAALPPGSQTVLIHDAARPFLTREVIDRVCAACGPGQAAFPALPIVDALWRAEDLGVTAAQPRDNLWRAQTPQGFHLPDILAAHQSGPADAPDDVALAHAAGLAVTVVMGDGNNFKITLAEDFQRGERLLRSDMDIRTGQGYDVHAFGPGEAVILCGVPVPHDKALTGHSDADVAMHAITDV